MKTDVRKRILSLFLVIGLLIGGGITIFAEESASVASACSDNSEMNLFFFLYNALKDKSGDIFSLLAAAVSLTLFLVVKQYLIPLLNRVLKSLMPEEENEETERSENESKNKL